MNKLGKNEEFHVQVGTTEAMYLLFYAGITKNMFSHYFKPMSLVYFD
jgi:hypothetical protein